MATERAENLTKKTPNGRPVRKTPGTRNRLALTNKDPNFEYRIVNDTPGRVAEMRERGYEVEDPAEVGFDKGRIEGGVTTDKAIAVGGGVAGVIMKIPKEWHEEDCKEKQRIADERVKSIQNDTSRTGNYGSITVS